MKLTLSKAFIGILIASFVIGLSFFFYQFFRFKPKLDQNFFLLQEAQIGLLQNDTNLTCIKLREVEERICGVRKQVPYELERSILVPAVNQEGKGVVATIQVEIEDGDGRILFDIQNVLKYYDTQDSARTALEVAKQITGADLSDKDVIYSIHAPSPVVRGPSAGAAMTIATIAAIENKTINQSVMITGQINHDGTIGLVSDVEPKARAAKENGANLFLVPLRQSEEVSYEKRKHCKEFDGFEYCTIEYVPVRKKITEIAGIEVREVGHIIEAMEYMLSE